MTGDGMAGERSTGADSLSIRSYTLARTTHAHEHDQIVVPIAGTMTMSFEAPCRSGPHRITPGHCIVIPAGTVHSYVASAKSRFLVADMACLPENAAALPEPCVAISADLRAFCGYAEVQLTTAADEDVSGRLCGLFRALLARQDFSGRVDPRIRRAVALIEADLSAPHHVADLAAEACLGTSQFRALFRRQFGLSFGEFLARRRMERARSLLTNTDWPVNAVALEVGYEDASAFSRRFRAHFGQSPRELARG